MVRLYGEKLPRVVEEKCMGLAWEIANYKYNPEATKETLTQAVGDMYIGLMAISYVFDLDPEVMGNYICYGLGVEQEETLE